MTLSRRRFASYAAGLAAVLVLGACSGAGAAPAGPTSTAVTRAPAPTTSTDATKSSATVDPVLARIPAEARPETMEGAAAYAEFYFMQLNKAFRAGDAAALDGLANASCTMCASLTRGVANVRQKGQHYGGDLARVNYASAMEFTPSSRRVLIDINQMQVPILDSTGREVDKTRVAKLAFVATLAFDGRWSITRLQKAAQ